MSPFNAVNQPRGTRAEPVKEARCPCCHALLFRYRAEGEAETKCRKCKTVVKVKLSR